MKLSTDKQNNILNLAKTGLKPIQIAKILNIAPSTTSQFLNREGYWFGFKNQGNIRFFQNIDSKEKAYILGFIAADGYIVKSNSSSMTLGIQIHIKDISVLEFIRDQIGCKKELTYPNDNMVRFTLSNKELVQDLLNLGIVQRKSLILTNVLAKIPSEFHTDFISGYFDGDGSVYLNKQTKNSIGSIIQIRGTEALLTAFIEPLGITNYQSFHDGKTWCLRFAKRSEIIKFYNFYKNSCFKLSRKFTKLEGSVNKMLSKYSKEQTIS